MKQYITQGYVDKLRDKDQATGVYYSAPKVIMKGDKYRKKLSPTEKLLYQEMYDLTMKALHKGQVDEKGNAYIESSYISLAVALGVSDSTIQRILSKKTNPLYTLGLLKIKQRKEQSTSQYYVMAPSYDGEDRFFLDSDYTTTQMKEEARQMVEKKNRKKPTKREVENEQLEDERMFDTKADKAEYKLQEKQFNDSLPNGVAELPQEQQETTEEQSQKELYFRVIDKQAHDGTYVARFVIAHNGKVVETLNVREFLKRTKSTIDINRHDSFIVKDIELEGKYEVRYES
ncbi:replication initiator protein A [Bacillus toyonensis]|nr:replication initiator protein A [Bacillus toyonensis]